MKKIINAQILQRLIQKFSLRELEDEVFALFEKVQPITNLDELLKTEKALTSTVAVSGTGNVITHTVPNGKRWTIKDCRSALSTGTYTFSAYGVNLNGVNATFDEFTQGTSYNSGKNNIVLNQADAVTTYINSYSGAGNLITTIIVTEEDAY